MGKADSLADINRVHPNIPEVYFGEEDHNTYYRLKQEATINELLLLTKHKNPVVSTYAFWALADRKHLPLGNVYREMLAADSFVEYYSACILSEEKSSNVMYTHVLENYLDNKADSIYTLQYNQVCNVIMDSLKDTYTFFNVMHHNNANPTHYSKIRRIALENKDILAIIELAKYRKESDVTHLLQLGNKAMLAIHHFPHKGFWNLLSDEINKQRPYPELFLAIAAYKNKDAAELLNKKYQRLNTLNDTTNIYILNLALSKYYCPLYKPTLSAIWLQQHYIEPNVIDTLISTDSVYAAQIFAKGLLSMSDINDISGHSLPERCLIDSIKTINGKYRFIIYDQYAIRSEFQIGFNTSFRGSCIKTMLYIIATHQPKQLAAVCKKLLPYSTDSYLLSVLLGLIDEYHIPNCDKDIFNKLTNSSEDHNIYLASKILLATDNSNYTTEVTNYVKNNKSYWKWGDSANKIKELFKGYNLDIGE